NLLVYGEGRGERPHLAAYAHLDVTDVVEGASAELVVDPAWRSEGIGRLLGHALIAESPDGRLRLWAHSDHPGASALARSMGLVQTRHLLQMRRSLFAPLPRPALPEGVSVRPFRPGADDADWLALNARAFSAHAEQGSWTLDDLRQRVDEPWFDPSGFFLAERHGPAGATLVGFHWTKTHGNDPSAHRAHGHDDPDDPAEAHGHGHEPIGEVYVVGVDPSEQGQGLGRALTLVGLQHLRSRGLSEVMLYVDADNAAAIELYRSLGFTDWDVDVMYGQAP
ncbi:MAG: mycothiol synthase, partial [Actinomycetes bacterium]